MPTQTIVLMIFPCAVVFAAVMDLLTFIIPNRLTLGLVLVFPAAALLAGLPGEAILLHAAAGLAMLAVGFVLFLPGWIGGGDAKLFGATALWLGFGPLPEFAFHASLIGGALTFAVLFIRRMPLPAILAGQDWAARLHEAKSGVPYGVALGLAALLGWPDAVLFQALAG
jgi:prepilin peptidase CpaA